MPSRADVQELAKAQFPNVDLAVVLAILDEYGIASYEQERERVQLAILKLSQGDEDRLLHNVAAAKEDFRDVLMWAEEPDPTPEQSAAELSMIQRLLKSLGVK
jgi:hypothetical protein